MSTVFLVLPKGSGPSTWQQWLAQSSDFTVERFEDSARALDRLRTQGTDIVVVHVACMEEPEPWVQAIRIENMAQHWIAVGPADLETAVYWMRRGVDYYLEEDADVARLQRALDAVRHPPPRPWMEVTHAEQTLLQFIREISRSLGDLEKLLNLAMDAAMEISQADYGALLLTHPHSGQLEVQQQRGNSQPGDFTWGFMGFRPEDLLEKFRQATPVLLPSPAAYTRQAHHPMPEIRAVLILPIQTPQKSLGGFLLAKTTGSTGNFTPSMVAILRTLAGDLGPVFHHMLVQMQTQELNFKDDLTDAYNRRYFERFLAEEIRRSERFGARLSIIFVDLDNLRAVNEQYGHMMGSKALQEVAHRMILAVRGSDRVVRYGGDEFCIILPETDTQGAIQVAERLRNEIANQPFLSAEGLGVRLTASFGVATFPIHGRTKEELVQAADKAMYRVKNTTKNGIAVAEVFQNTSGRTGAS